MECELTRARIVKYEDRDSVHSHDHLLLRINDSEEVQSREVNNVRLQRELINITTDLRSLEQKVTTHLRAASKVNTVLRRFTADGEVKVAFEHPPNGVSVINGEATATAGVEEAVGDDDDNASDLFGSIYSSDAESEELASAPNTPPPAEPHSLPVDPDAEASGEADAVAAGSAETVARPESEPLQPEIPVTVPQVVGGAFMDTPTPTSARFFDSFTDEPAHSESLQRGSGLSDMANGQAPAPALEAVPVEPLAPTSKSRQLNNHLVSLDTRISSLDTRISSLDTRLNGMESQLGEILALLRQSRS
jgi:hypothetical protein